MEIQKPLQHLSNVSFSRLKTFSNCPKQFEYKYIKEAPSIPTNLNVSFGSSLHFGAQQFVQFCLDKKHFPSLSYIKEQFSNHWVQSIQELQVKFGKEHMEKLVTDSRNTQMVRLAISKMKNGPSITSNFNLQYWNVLGMEILERFYSRERESLCIIGSNTRIFDFPFSEIDDLNWMHQYLLLNKQLVQFGTYRIPLYTEKKFDFNLLQSTDTSLRGAIDRIDMEWTYDEKTDEYKENIVLIEYKTDISPRTLSKHIEQIYVYVYAMRKELGLPISKAVLCGLRTGEEFVIPIEDSKVEKIENWLLDTVIDISKTREFIPTPSPTKCKHCEFKNICPSAYLGR